MLWLGLKQPLWTTKPCVQERGATIGAQVFENHELPYFTCTAFLGALETSNLFGLLLFGVLYSSPT